MRRRLLFMMIKKNDVTELPDIPVNPDVEVNNKIYYTTTNNNLIKPYSTSAFDANILSNALDSNLNMFVIEFDADLTTIGDNAFRNKSGLANVIIPNTVTTIGERAFYHCNKLAAINTGDNLISVGPSAFSTCSLTNIYLGPNVTSIGRYAFYGCDQLQKVYCKAEVPPAGEYGMFEDIADSAVIYVPHDSVNAYKSARYWNDVADLITGYDF